MFTNIEKKTEYIPDQFLLRCHPVCGYYNGFNDIKASYLCNKIFKDQMIDIIISAWSNKVSIVVMQKQKSKASWENIYKWRQLVIFIIPFLTNIRWKESFSNKV